MHARPLRLGVSISLWLLAAAVGTHGAQSRGPAEQLAELIGQNRVTEAIELGNQWLSEHGHDPAFREQLGRAHFVLSERLAAAGRPAAAIERARRTALGHLQETLRLAPPPPPARIYLAISVLNAHLGQYPAANLVATAGLRAHPESVPLLRNRAQARGELGQWADAIADWDALLAIAPTDIDAAISRSNAYFESGRPEDAAAQLRAACFDAPGAPGEKDWRAHYNLGRFLILGRHFEASVEPLERAADLAPQEAIVAIELADALYRVSRATEAAQILDRWLAPEATLDRPQRIQALFRRGVIARNAGDSAQARQRFESVLALQPSHEGALQGLGALLLAAGEEVRGRELLDRFRRVAPVALDMRIARQKVRRSPGSPQPRLDLIDQLLRLPEPIGARLEIEDFARRFPGHRELPTLRRRLAALESPGAPEKP